MQREARRKATTKDKKMVFTAKDTNGTKVK